MRTVILLSPIKMNFMLSLSISFYHYVINGGTKLTRVCTHTHIHVHIFTPDTGHVEFYVAPFKSEERAGEKAKDDYVDRHPGPSISWLFDIARCLMCTVLIRSFCFGDFVYILP